MRSLRSKLLLLGACSIAYVPTASADIGPDEGTRRVCERNNGCALSAAVKCSYFEDGVQKDCIVNGLGGNSNQSPFLTIPEGTCGKSLFATIDYEICNNMASDTVQGNNKFIGTYSNVDISPSDWTDDLPPSTCRTHSISRSIDTCKRIRNMEVAVEGRFGGQGEYCRCYLFKTSIIEEVNNPNPDPQPNPRVKKTCVRANGCSAEVGLSCTYDDNGVTKDCIVNVENDNTTPFLTIPAGTCGDTITATIDYSICNTMSNPFVPNDKTLAMYNEALVTPTGWRNDFAAGECREHSITRSFTTCERQRNMAAAFEGNFQGSNGSREYCRCYFFKSSIIAERGDPAPSPTAPAPSPTYTTPPAPSPTVNPMLCTSTAVIITELASPADEPYGRYIELYFPECKGKIINKNLNVIRWPYGKADFSPNSIDLQGTVVPDDGFIVLCNSARGNDLYDNKCDSIEGVQSPANVGGKDTIAVIEGEPEPNSGFDIIDIFGKVAVDHPKQNIEGGRAVRKTSVVSPKDLWNPDNWVIFPGEGTTNVGYKGMDPREWKDVPNPPDVTLIITEIIDPNREHPVPRYVEIHAPNQHDHGKNLDDDLYVVIFRGDDEELDWNTRVRINYIPANGFIVLCNQYAYDSKFYGDNECTYYATTPGVSPGSGPGDSDGNDQIAIIAGDEDDYLVLDIFGVIGEDGTGTDHDFQDSRAVRKIHVTDPKSMYDADDWWIKKSDGSDADPNEWKGHTAPSPTPPDDNDDGDDEPDCYFFITELADPTDAKPLGSYIEIMSTCPGEKISAPINVVSWKYGDDTCVQSLEDFIVPDDGFIIICFNHDYHDLLYGEDHPCDIENPRLVSDGYHPVAITYGDPDNVDSCDFLDVYGEPGTNFDDDPDYIFANGRVVRKVEYPYPSVWFRPEFWRVIPGAGEEVAFIDDMDPREWKDSELILFITEIADPSDEPDNRFIELYSPNKRNYKIVDNIMLMKWLGESAEPSGEFDRLKDLVIDENGFLVLCVTKNYWGWEKCDYNRGPFSVANSVGSNHIALSLCAEGQAHPSNDCECLDMYGRVGTNGAHSDHDFTMGRAIRLRDASPVPKKIFDVSQWYIVPGEGYGEADSGQCNPGEWPDESSRPTPNYPHPTPIRPTYPHPTPTRPAHPQPTPRAPSKGKSKKSKH